MNQMHVSIMVEVLPVSVLVALVEMDFRMELAVFKVS